MKRSSSTPPSHTPRGDSSGSHSLARQFPSNQTHTLSSVRLHVEIISIVLLLLDPCGHLRYICMCLISSVVFGAGAFQKEIRGV